MSCLFPASLNSPPVWNFISAARAGKWNLLNGLVHFMDDYNRGPLHYAAWDGLTNVCKYLLEEMKFDVNARDRYDTTPVAFAAKEGHTETAKYLVENGAGVKDRVEVSAMHLAARYGNFELMKFLLDNGVSVNLQNNFAYTPLIEAVTCNDEHVVKFLLNEGANINGSPGDDRTPLYTAISARSIECLKLLIKEGAEVNSVENPQPLLHLAAYRGIPQFINCLLKASASPDATTDKLFPDDLDDANSLPRKPIEIAATFNNMKAVEILFPITAPIDKFKKWSVDGIIKQAISEFETKRAAQLLYPRHGH